jgi:hypothetical protein
MYRHTSSSPVSVLCSEYHDTDRGLPDSIASKSDSGKPERYPVLKPAAPLFAWHLASSATM